MMKTPTIGIDFGSSQVSAAVWQEGRVYLVADQDGRKTFPAFVAFTEEGIFVGEAAEKQAAINTKNTIYDLKRLLGRSFHDPGLHEDLKRWPFTLVHESGRPKVEVDLRGVRRRFGAEEIAALLLSEVRNRAELTVGVPVRDAVISVPANFCDSQRQAVLDAATIADLNILQLINEPTAAALALQKELRGVRTLLVFDLGASSLDASLVRVDRETVEVLASSGTVHLGGRDFDARLATHLVSEFLVRHGTDLRSNATALQRMRAACQEAKHALSDTPSTVVELDALMDGIDFRATISVQKFEELCRDLFQASLEPVRKVLQEARLSESQVDNVLMVGAAANMSRLQNLLGQMFDGKEVLRDGPELLVSRGAAIQAAILDGQRPPTPTVREVAPWTISIEMYPSLDYEVVLENSSVPCNRLLTLGGHSNDPGRSLDVFEADRNGNKNLVGSLKVSKLPLSLNLAVDQSGVIKVTSKSGDLFRKVNTLTFNEVQVTKEAFQRLLVKEKIQKIRLEAKEKVQTFVRGVQKDMDRFKQKLSQADKDTVKNVCAEMDVWLLQNYNSDEELFEERCRQKIFEVESALAPVLTNIQALQKKERNNGASRKIFGSPHLHIRPCGLQAEQEQPFDYSMRRMQANSRLGEN